MANIKCSYAKYNQENPMRTNDFRSLNDTIRGIRGVKSQPAKQQINESVEAVEESTVPAELVEAVTNIIADAETRLGTQFTAEEIAYSTNYILEQLKATALVEAVQNYVGFELNEEEIQYLFKSLNENVGE